ncbi:MAG: Stp1/IreP family PP2C-type Ser/Thr phosphatase [Clostridiales bacterium]|nr:Stp1/IreP family PP2C-type Ser/Thr phosphatase [Clostridiales bacterium]
MKAVSRTHIGNVRKSNQDALLVQPGEFGLYGVADGMGGHKAGDVASRMAVDTLKEALAGARPGEELLRNAIMKANADIYEAQLSDPDLNGMGTTLTVIWEDKRRILLGHVGDSRAYRVRGGKIEQISQDHSMVAELVRDGLITQEEALIHPYRNIITRALGVDEEVTADVFSLNKRRGDKYLICSDGLSEYVRENEMQEILCSMPMSEAADKMLSMALDGGGHDNISLVIAEVSA